MVVEKLEGQALNAALAAKPSIPAENLVETITSEELDIVEAEPNSFPFIRFDLGKIDSNSKYGPVKLVGKIPMVHPPEFYAKVNQVEVEQLVSDVEKWMFEQDVVLKSEKGKHRKVLEEARCLAIQAAMTIPEVPLTDEKLQAAIIIETLM